MRGGRQFLLDPTVNSPEVRDFENALRERVVGQRPGDTPLGACLPGLPGRPFYARAVRW